MPEVQLKAGWLRRDVQAASIVVARQEVEAATRRVRNANDELAEASTALKVAEHKLRKVLRR